MTDEERREVAERLRGDPCDTLIPYRTGIHFGMGCHEAANRFWDMCERIKSAGDYDIAHSTRSVLADLIDPDCEEGRYSVARTVRPVDRDALLALADKVVADTEEDVRSEDLVPAWQAGEALLALADELSGNILVVPAVYGTYQSGYVAACQDIARRIREACGEVVK